MPSSPNEPIWLTADDLIETNKDEVSETGETHLLRDRGLAEMATHRPRNIYWYEGERDVVRLGLHLLMGVAQNLPSSRGTSAPR